MKKHTQKKKREKIVLKIPDLIRYHGPDLLQNPLQRPVTIAKVGKSGSRIFSDFRLPKFLSGTTGNIKSEVGNLK